MTKVKTTGGVSTRVGGGVTVKGRTPSSIKVSEDGSFKGTQPEINFTGDVTVTNDPANNRVNVDIDGGAGGIEHFLGIYTTLVALQAAYPTASPGDYADVDPGLGADAIRYIWDEEEGWIAGGGGTVGGSDTQVQFNDAGSFGGDADWTYNKTTNTQTIKGGVIVSDETASRIAHFDANKQVKALDTATYPSLTELSYLKGAYADMNDFIELSYLRSIYYLTGL